MPRHRPAILFQNSRSSPFKLAGLLLLACAIVGLTACASTPQGQNGSTLTVFAAASLTEAFTQAAGTFEEERPGVSVSVHYAGSQQLRTQLEHGARADVFASADWRQMEGVIASGLVLGQPRDLATNRLVVITPGASGSGNAGGLEYLAESGVKLVLAAPNVPAGAYAREVIHGLEDDPAFGTTYPEQVLSNVVSWETNVRSVVQKVALGEADAGIVYQTDANSVQPGGVRVIPIPDESNVTARYPIAVLRGASQPELARSFVRFMATGRGQDVLVRHGFGRGATEELPVNPGTSGGH